MYFLKNRIWNSKFGVFLFILLGKLAFRIIPINFRTFHYTKHTFMKNIRKICLLALCIVCFYNAGAQTELTYYTTMGNFKIILTDAQTPRTVDSFIARVSHKFYDGLLFHRVIDNFMIQGGDPLGTGYGGPGYTTPDEFVPSLKNVPGALAMANSGPNTNGSQFYINLVTNSSLDGHYTVCGMVSTGFVNVQNIGHVATNTSDRPLVNVVMDSVRITHLHTLTVNTAGNGVALNVYPNPGRGMVNIDLPNVNTKVEILNMLGRTVYSSEGKGTLKVDLREQGAGLYIVRVSNVKGASETKLVVQ
jgi:cyclophilin family peptidyl-prolyl cis-trans isomerase